jgi:hypothetical protein
MTRIEHILKLLDLYDLSRKYEAPVMADTAKRWVAEEITKLCDELEKLKKDD